MGRLSAVVVLVSMLAYLSRTDALAVMSVDLGSEFMKVAIVKPGVPMEIALNKESQRKTPVVVSMRDGERAFGDPALSTAVKYPKMAYRYLLDLLGKNVDNPYVKAYKERYNYHTIVEDPVTKGVVFKHDDETSYTVEELLAMILEKAKETAEVFAEQPIGDAVITVPPFFNQAERRALLRAAEMSGLKVLQLMNTNTAVALNYGIFRRKEFNATAQNLMFFDMGSSSTTATIVSYQVVKNKNALTGITDSQPQVMVRGIGFDRTLGGTEFQIRLRDHLAKLFNEQKKTTNDVLKSPRAMAKLFKEAGRVKNVLSANTETYAQIESLLDDQDFKAKVTREELEEICKDLYERVAKPVKDVLASSEMTWDELSDVILMGGGTRVPKVQDILKEVTKRTELGKSINTDEAAAMGAVYQAAHLSTGFKVKAFGIKEATIYPIQVEFERMKLDESSDASKTVKRTLFGRNNPYPQKKVMTFNKHVSDFGFDVNYGDLSFLTEPELKVFGSNNIQKVKLEGVDTAFASHKDDAEPKGIKAHFQVDNSGIITLDRVEFQFEKAPEPEKEEESTMSNKTKGAKKKIGSFLFGSSDDEKKEGVVQTEEGKNKTEKTEEKSEGKDDEEKKSEEKTDDKDEKKSEDKEKETPKEGEKPKKEEGDKKTSEEKQESSKEEAKEDEKKEQAKKEEAAKEGEKKDEKDEKKDDKAAKEKKLKPTLIKEPITSTLQHVDIVEPSADAIKASKDRIVELKKKDIEKDQLEKAHNELEAFIYDIQSKMSEPEYEKCSTEEERTKLIGIASAASDWMYDLDAVAAKEVYEEKLAELKKETKDLWERVKEMQERPRALEAFNSILNYTSVFLESMKNYTGEDLPFTTTEYETLEKLIASSKEWKKTALKEQKEASLTEKPKLLVETIAMKMASLDREVKYLINKAKTFKPKAKPAEDSNTTTANETKPDKKKTEEEIKTEKSEKEPVSDEESIEIELPPKPSDKKETKEKEPADEETLEIEADTDKDYKEPKETKEENHHTPDDEL